MAQGQRKSVPDRDWPALRVEYETSPISIRRMGVKHGISRTTLEQRQRKEKWKKPQTLVNQVASTLEKRGEELARKHIEAELAPYIEAKKASFTRMGVELGEVGLTRISDYFGRVKKIKSPKDEAMIAKAATDYHRAGRTALGLNDGVAAVGPINFNVLMGGANWPNEPSAGSDL